MSDRPLHPVRRVHLEELGGPLGIWQHASRTVPDRSFGYCTDDVARALTVDLLHAHELGWEAVAPDARRSLAFLRAAFDPATASFRNFRSADGAWLDAVSSEDSQGRALLALGSAVRDGPEAAVRREAGSLFEAALPMARRLTSPRAVSSAILGCDAALDAGLPGDSLRTLVGLAGRLGRAFGGLDLDGGWPWPESVLTYENALLPHALIVAGHRLADPDLRRMGLRVLDWLIRVQTSPDSSFSPVGNDGWWPRDGARSRFDQQPIEPAAMILAASAALRETHDEPYRRAAEAAYAWFLGGNDAGIPVADASTGGCHDGLSPRGVNLNQGAESTLMWLTALETMRSIRSRAAAVAAAAARPRPTRRRLVSVRA